MQKWILLFLLSVIIAAFVNRPVYLHTEPNPYHSSAFMSAYGGLPDTLNSLFTGSGKCAGCHSKDPNFLASIRSPQTQPQKPRNFISSTSLPVLVAPVQF